MNKISSAIGANRTIPLSKKTSGTPLDWLDVAYELESRLISTGGRPSDPEWDTRRIVPFKHEVWNYLVTESKLISQKGKKISPAQLAAIIIEKNMRKS